MSRWRSGRIRRRWIVLAVLLVIPFIPLDRYRPSCDDLREIRMAGPMRDVYVDSLTEVLTWEGFLHIRIGNEIFFSLVDSFRIPGVGAIPARLNNLLRNWEWRIASNIAYGYGPGDSRIQPPPILLDLMKKEEERLDEKYPQRKGEWRPRELFYRNCELIRAAAIRIEDMRPEDLEEFTD